MKIIYTFRLHTRARWAKFHKLPQKGRFETIEEEIAFRLWQRFDRFACADKRSSVIVDVKETTFILIEEPNNK
jgi:hypothetical protein